MYYEERLIDGVMHWRNDPNDEFTVYTIQELSVRYASLLKHANELYAKVNQEGE